MTEKRKKSVKKQPARIGVLVLGMHRSGTSALTGLLHFIGCDLPAHLLPANVGNELGHWEAETVMRLNDEMLASAGSCWNDWIPIGQDWYAAPSHAQFLESARETLRTEFPSTSLFVLKDPRICRLAPLWLEAMDEEQISPRIVIPLRNPLEVSASLLARDRIESSYGQLLWLRHVLDAEYSSRGRKRIFCTYNQLLDDTPALIERAQATLDIVWPNDTASSRKVISEFLSKESRHHAEAEEVVLDNLALSHWLRDSYATLLRWSEDREKKEDYATLDAIRHEFDAATRAFDPLVGPERLFSAAGGGPDKVQLEQELATAQSRADAAEAAIKDFQTQMDQALSREADLNARLERSSLEIARVLPELEASRAASASDHHRFATTEANLRQNVDALNREVETLNTALEVSRSETTKLNHLLATTESTLQQRLEEIDQTRQALDEARQQAQARTNDIEKLNKRITDADAWVFRLAGDRRVAEMATDAAKRDLASAQRIAEAATRAKDVALAKAQQMEERLKARADENVPAPIEESPAAVVEESAPAVVEESAPAIVEESTPAVVEEGPLEAPSNHEAEFHKLASEIETQKLINDQLSRELNESNEAKSNAAAALDERFREISIMTRLLRQSEGQRGEHSTQIDWLRQVNAVLMASPRWWSFMPFQWSRKKELRRLKMRGLFDAEHYLALHPDVEAEGMDPLRHYILHGMAEGRSR